MRRGAASGYTFPHSYGPAAADRRVRYTAGLMLDPNEIFPLYAELALGLAGFAGVVSAYAGREREFKSTERVRLFGVLVASACVLGGCFVFFAALAAGLEPEVAYRISGVVCLSFSLAFFLPIFSNTLKHARDADSTSEPWSLGVSACAYFTISGLYVVSIATDFGFFGLVSAFSVQLLRGLWMFIRLLTRPN